MAKFGDGVEVAAPATARAAEVLTPGAVAFVVGLQRAFNARRKELLTARVARQRQWPAVERLD